MAEGSDTMVGEIIIRNVHKEFTGTDGAAITALENIDLTVPAGSFISIIGPSGCGKTTLLRAISGLGPADRGTISIDGKEVKEPGADKGYAFQQANLFPWLTIEKNIAFGLKARGVFKREREEVRKYMTAVGLTEFAKSYPHQLSGGMCQRASLARALVGHPEVLLLDEPLGALDAFTRMNMQDMILDLWQEYRMTTVMVTHDVDEAVYMSDHVVVMTPRPAKIEEIISIKMPRPRKRGLEEFFQYRKKILEILNYAGNITEPEYVI